VWWGPKQHRKSLHISAYSATRTRIGNFFTGLFNYIKPLFLSGITALKNQAAETCKAVINEFGRKNKVKLLYKIVQIKQLIKLPVFKVEVEKEIKD